MVKNKDFNGQNKDFTKVLKQLGAIAPFSHEEFTPIWRQEERGHLRSYS